MTIVICHSLTNIVSRHFSNGRFYSFCSFTCVNALCLLCCARARERNRQCDDIAVADAICLPKQYYYTEKMVTTSCRASGIVRASGSQNFLPAELSYREENSAESPKTRNTHNIRMIRESPSPIE